MSSGTWSESRRFALSYAAISGSLFASYFVFTFPYSGWPYALFTRYLHVYALVAATLLRAFDPLVSVSQNDIVGRTSLAIVRGCDGSEVLILFAGAVLASHLHSWRLRLVGVVVGIAALSAANVARICSLYFVGVHAPSSMELWHLELWPLILVLLAVGLFLFWGRWASARPGVTG